jgi:hypothetical protein
MPTDINVADGKLANWHRFDALNRAVTKDVHILMSVADSTTNAVEQIQAIWTKLGGSNAPPRVDSFNRKDLGKNAASQLPAKFPTFTKSFDSVNLIAFNLNLDFDIGGAAPTGVNWEATPTGGGATQTGTFNLTYPYLWFGNYVWAASGTFTTGTDYNFRARLVNPFGSGTFSDIVVAKTNS